MIGIFSFYSQCREIKLFPWVKGQLKMWTILDSLLIICSFNLRFLYGRHQFKLLQWSDQITGSNCNNILGIYTILNKLETVFKHFKRTMLVAKNPPAEYRTSLGLKHTQSIMGKRQRLGIGESTEELRIGKLETHQTKGNRYRQGWKSCGSRRVRPNDRQVHTLTHTAPEM